MGVRLGLRAGLVGRQAESERFIAGARNRIGVALIPRRTFAFYTFYSKGVFFRRLALRGYISTLPQLVLGSGVRGNGFNCLLNEKLIFFC